MLENRMVEEMDDYLSKGYCNEQEESEEIADQEENQENEYFDKLIQEDDLLDEIDKVLEQMKAIKDRYNIDILSVSVGNRCAMSSAHYEDEIGASRIASYDYNIVDGNIVMNEHK